MTNVLEIITGKAQEVFTKMNDKNCVTKVEIFVDVKSYFILDSPAKGQTMRQALLKSGIQSSSFFHHFPLNPFTVINAKVN